MKGRTLLDLLLDLIEPPRGEDDTLGASETVVALVSPLTAAERHSEAPCAVGGCREPNFFDTDHNYTSKFCADHAKEPKMPEIACTGRGSPSGDHCCYVAGKTCAFLLDNGIPGDGRFRCGLRVELGSWEAVHADPRYAPIQAVWDEVGISSCGEWESPPGRCCKAAR